jgi:hypothetical protein
MISTSVISDLLKSYDLLEMEIILTRYVLLKRDKKETAKSLRVSYKTIYNKLNQAISLYGASDLIDMNTYLSNKPSAIIAAISRLRREHDLNIPISIEMIQELYKDLPPVQSKKHHHYHTLVIPTPTPNTPSPSPPEEPQSPPSTTPILLPTIPEFDTSNTPIPNPSETIPLDSLPPLSNSIDSQASDYRNRLKNILTILPQKDFKLLIVQELQNLLLLIKPDPSHYPLYRYLAKLYFCIATDTSLQLEAPFSEIESQFIQSVTDLISPTQPLWRYITISTEKEKLRTTEGLQAF